MSWKFFSDIKMIKKFSNMHGTEWILLWSSEKSIEMKIVWSGTLKLIVFAHKSCFYGAFDSLSVSNNVRCQNWLAIVILIICLCTSNRERIFFSFSFDLCNPCNLHTPIKYRSRSDQYLDKMNPAVWIHSKHTYVNIYEMKS